jgi:hypothetical protein
MTSGWAVYLQTAHACSRRASVGSLFAGAAYAHVHMFGACQLLISVAMVQR